MVRQEISSGKARQEARLRSHSGGEIWRAARDQIAVDSAAGAGCADRWLGCAASDYRKCDLGGHCCFPALGSPKVFETRWRQFRISHRMLNIFVAEVGLQRPGIMPSVRQCITTRMAQHVRMHT